VWLCRRTTRLVSVFTAALLLASGFSRGVSGGKTAAQTGSADPQSQNQNEKASGASVRGLSCSFRMARRVVGPQRVMKLR